MSEISLAQLQARFEQKVRLSPDELSRVADRIVVLRRRYNDQLQRTRIQFVDPRFKLESCQPLMGLARAIASISQLVYEALRSLDNVRTATDLPVVAPAIIEDALVWNDAQLDRLAGQFGLLDAADTQSAWLAALLGRLTQSVRVSSFDWAVLARDVIAVGTATEAKSPLLLPGLMLKSYLAESGRPEYAEAVARGIESARIIAALLPSRPRNGFNPELLILAALCQDCGLVLGPSHSASTNAAVVKKLRSLHASVGAGLVAALVDYSTELPALVAQHHRRLNEARLATGEIPRLQHSASRLLAITARWLELVEQQSAQTDFTVPAAQLASEAIRGDWDRQLAGEFLTALGFRAESETLGRTARAASAIANRDGARRRLDASEENWPQPNLGLTQQPRETRNVRASAR